MLYYVIVEAGEMKDSEVGWDGEFSTSALLKTECNQYPRPME